MRSDHSKSSGIAKDFDILKIREEFPALHQRIHNNPLIYFDNAATTLKPKVVLESLMQYYSQGTANIHRGIHYLSEQATASYEEVRTLVQGFLHARHSHEIVFTKGTTDGINLVASSYGNAFFKEGDEILISLMEHHSNIVPWQMLAKKLGCHLKIVPINDQGEILMEEFQKLLSHRTKFISMVLISNSLGTINPLQEMISQGRRKAPHAKILVDAAQAVGHLEIDVQALDCDFLCFSGHKLLGPTGVGVLYGKQEILEEMPPYQFGGDMIDSVSFEETTFNCLPYKFEAGTPPIAEVIGLGAAIKFIKEMGLKTIAERESSLLAYATNSLLSIPGLAIIGRAKSKSAILSFTMDKIHPHDIGTLADQEGIALRTGHHCTQPAMKRLKVSATARASLAFYNTKEEIDFLKVVLLKIKDTFK